eukprot:5855432-Ditylum_brightwellii.AAC.1
MSPDDEEAHDSGDSIPLTSTPARAPARSTVGGTEIAEPVAPQQARPGVQEPRNQLVGGDEDVDAPVATPTVVQGAAVVDSDQEPSPRTLAGEELRLVMM